MNIQWAGYSKSLIYKGNSYKSICFEMIDIMGTCIPFKVDTGAETNLISEKLCNKCVQKVQEKPELIKRNKTLKSINSKTTNYVGMTVVPFKVKKKTVNAEIQ